MLPAVYSRLGEIRQDPDMVAVCSSHWLRLHGFLQKQLFFGKVMALHHKWPWWEAVFRRLTAEGVVRPVYGWRLLKIQSSLSRLTTNWYGCFPCSRRFSTPVMRILQCHDLASKSSQRSLSVASSFFITLTSAPIAADEAEWPLTSSSSSDYWLSAASIRFSTCSTAHRSSVRNWPIWFQSSADWAVAFFFHFRHQILF